MTGVATASSLIGHRTINPPILVEAGQIRLFCEAIGETDPIHLDEEAARAAGYSGLLAPLTFSFCLWCLANDPSRPFHFFTPAGVSLGSLLHGRQWFRYHGPICAGDSIGFESEMSNVHEKKNGELLFMESTSIARNQRGETVTEFGSTFISRRAAA